jgi:AcrR family transcriptional regulator
MPPKAKFTKQALIDAAIALIREHGSDALSARNLAARLGCSSRPIFTLYDSMNALQHDVLTQAYTLYHQYIAKETESQKYPPYKASGMAYIRFAMEETELFKLLFMRERTKEERSSDFCDPIIVERIVQANPTLTEKQARQLYLSMWIHSHGIATMLVTAYYSITMDEISEQLTLAYLSIRDQILKKGLPT